MCFTASSIGPRPFCPSGTRLDLDLALVVYTIRYTCWTVDRYFSENMPMALRLLLSLSTWLLLAGLSEGVWIGRLPQSDWPVACFGALFFIANWCGRGFPSPPKQMFLVCRSKQAKQTRNQLSSVVSASVPAWVAFDFSPMVDCDSEVKSHKPFLASPGCFQSVFCYHDWKQTRALLNCLRMWLSGWMLDWCVQGSGLWS